MLRRRPPAHILLIGLALAICICRASSFQAQPGNRVNRVLRQQIIISRSTSYAQHHSRSLKHVDEDFDDVDDDKDLIDAKHGDPINISHKDKADEDENSTERSVDIQNKSGKPAEQQHDGTDAEDAHGDAVDDLKEVRALTKGMGFSEDDLKELKAMQDEKGNDVGNNDQESGVLFRSRDRHPDGQPPLGMVARPAKAKEPISKADSPTAPNEPDSAAANALPLSETLRLEKENADYAKRFVQMAKSLENAEKEALHAKREASRIRTELERSKDSFQNSLRSARGELKSEKEDMTNTIEEQRKAFDELLEEKQLLTQLLSDEQKTLTELQEKIQHPDLGLWVRQRAQRATILVDTPETDAVKYYAKKYMAPKVTKMRNRLHLLEKRVERTVDHLLPAKYGWFVAILLCVGLVGFPVFVTMSTVVSVTKSVSLRQYVLLGNVFLTAFSAGVCIAGVILQQDPLQTLYEASESVFIMLQLATAIAFPVFLAVIAFTVLKARDRLDMFVFGCEFVFYSLVAMNYRSRVWRPAMLGQNIETGTMMYVVYVMDFMSMTALTISSARTDGGGAFMDMDVEIGEGGKVAGVTGGAALPGTGSNMLSSLGSGLLNATLRSGGHGSGKQE